MKNIAELMMVRLFYKELLRTMDAEASFDTEEGRVYANTLVKLVMIEMQIEAIQKEKIAH
ncbi:hypothetical protein [Cohnella soli]|uniref:Uncharacterized protein n=1 Tax=Cohnella soli TaxID=425005 RepID=A0ABW0I1E2_9BACL